LKVAFIEFIRKLAGEKRKTKIEQKVEKKKGRIVP